MVKEINQKWLNNPIEAWTNSDGYATPVGVKIASRKTSGVRSTDNKRSLKANNNFASIASVQNILQGPKWVPIFSNESLHKWVICFVNTTKTHANAQVQRIWKPISDITWNVYENLSVKYCMVGSFERKLEHRTSTSSLRLSAPTNANNYFLKPSQNSKISIHNKL